jgi:hypothetical protein
MPLICCGKENDVITKTPNNTHLPSIDPSGLNASPSPEAKTAIATTALLPIRNGVRDSAQNLGNSLLSSWMELVQKSPDLVEEQEMQRAIELSLLDCALVTSINRSRRFNATNDDHDSINNNSNSSIVETIQPHKVLGVPANANAEQIRSSYKKKALSTHPDKGGSASEFALVAWAYRTLLHQIHTPLGGGHDKASPRTSAAISTSIKTTAHWDAELKEHKDLVAELFASHASDLTTNITKQLTVRKRLGLVHQEAGSSNVNERQERIRNSCFYLSLAVSYLSGIGALMCNNYNTSDDNRTNDHNQMDHSTGSEYTDEILRATDQALISQTALQLKRTIEGGVLRAHPEWARAGLVGEEVQAFSDFLVYILDSETNILSECAVAVFDETSGFVDIYKGSFYDEMKSEHALRSNTLTLRFVPGHYQPLLSKNPGEQQQQRPSLGEIISALDREGVLYVVTDGAA